MKSGCRSLNITFVEVRNDSLSEIRLSISSSDILYILSSDEMCEARTLSSTASLCLISSMASSSGLLLSFEFTFLMMEMHVRSIASESMASRSMYLLLATSFILSSYLSRMILAFCLCNVSVGGINDAVCLIFSLHRRACSAVSLSPLSI